MFCDIQDHDMLSLIIEEIIEKFQIKNVFTMAKLWQLLT